MGTKLSVNPANVRGFNYHPSYSTGSLEDWLLFDFSVWDKELRRGKQMFPNMNTVRIWLSWNAWCRLENRFIKEVRQVIDLCKDLGLYVIPILFNRWHDPMIDCDGIYIDHFLPGSSWLLKYGDPFNEYIDALSQEFKNENQILVWDVCNEPLAYGSDFPLEEEIRIHELNWLHRMADRLRQGGVSQPLGLGSIGGGQSMSFFDDFIDVYLTHMYCQSDEKSSSFEKMVCDYVEEAKNSGKPLICSECCWGALDDSTRAGIVKTTLSVLKKYNIGFVAHALQYCGCTDLHYRKDGRLSPDVGNLSFTNKDGSIRLGHDCYCEF